MFFMTFSKFIMIFYIPTLSNRGYSATFRGRVALESYVRQILLNLDNLADR